MKIWSHNREIIFQDRREGFMKNVSCFIFVCSIQKVQQLSKSPTRSLDSPYTEHGNPHFHTKHRLNWLPHEYINTWLQHLAPCGYTKCARFEVAAEP